MKQQLEKTIDRLLRKGQITGKEAFDLLRILAYYHEPSTPFITTSQCENTLNDLLYTPNLIDSSGYSGSSIKPMYSI